MAFGRVYEAKGPRCLSATKYNKNRQKTEKATRNEHQGPRTIRATQYEVNIEVLRWVKELIHG